MKLFFTPFKYPYPPSELELLRRAKQYNIHFLGNKIAIYEYGIGPTVIFAHGWSGRGTQFKKFVPDFVKQGYKVVLFDAPGHGNSGGKTVNLIEYGKLLKLISEKYENLIGIVGHSLGGVAMLHSIALGVELKAAVTICSPTISDEILNEFCARINAKHGVKKAIRNYIKLEFKIDFDAVSALKVVETLSMKNYMICHDINDAEVPVKHAEAMHQKVPNAYYKIVESQGHTKVLKDKKVIAEILNFMDKSLEAENEGTLIGINKAL